MVFVASLKVLEAFDEMLSPSELLLLIPSVLSIRFAKQRKNG